MVRELEVVRHPALARTVAALDALAERRSDEVTAEVVDPLVIRAHELVGMAARRPAERHAPMGAAIEKRPQRPVRLAHDDDGLLADPGGDEVAGLGHLTPEGDVRPERAAEHALLLERVHIGVGVDPVRDAGHALLRPRSHTEILSLDEAQARRRRQIDHELREMRGEDVDAEQHGMIVDVAGDALAAQHR